MLRYYVDTEFYENGKTIDLISIGVVCSDGREFYRVSRDADYSRIAVESPWLMANVIPHLPSDVWSPGEAIVEYEGLERPAPYRSVWATREEIARDLCDFVVGDPKLQFWGFYADYDWVVLCQLYGTMMGLPKHFPRFCMDLKQLSVSLGSPQHPKQTGMEHDALQDARFNRDLHEFLLEVRKSGR